MDKLSTLSQRLKKAKVRDLHAQNLTNGNHFSADQAPLAFAQERFWFLDQMNSGSSLNNRAFAWKLTGPFHPAFFTKAVDKIVERHEVLRTTIVTRDNQPKAIVNPPTPLDIPFIDLTHRPNSFQDEALRVYQRPILLEQAPLLNVAIFKLDNDKHVALFVMPCLKKYSKKSLQPYTTV